MSAASDRSPRASAVSNEPTIEHWLTLLRDGTDDERARARTELGLVLEARGQVEDAAEAYLTNVKARVRDRRPYERLAAICRDKGDTEWETRVLLTMHSVFAEPTKALREPTPAPPGRSYWLLAIVGVVLVAIGVAAVVASMLPSSSPRVAIEPQPTGEAASVEAPKVPPTSTSAPEPTAPATPTAEPATKAPTAIAPPSRQQPPVAPSTVPGCTDPARHYPEWADPEGSVFRAFNQAFPGGGSPLNPGYRRLRDLALSDPAATVARWMATDIAAAQTNRRSLPLSDYVAQQANRRMALGSSPSALTLPLTTVSAEAWQSILRSPPNICIGAMLQDPSNAQLVRLMGSAVIPSGGR